LAYRLRPDESVARGLRRLARKELGKTRDALGRASPPRAEAIHEARTRIKKVRAIVELIDADRGDGLSGCKKRLRAINRTLSCLRDADAMVEILTTLRQRDRQLLDEHTFARIKRRLSSRKRAAMEEAEQNSAWQEVDADLGKLRRAAKDWQPAHRGFRAIAAGIRASHRRGRKAMARARKSQDAVDFHEWRKAIKALWYHLRLVEQSDRRVRQDVKTLYRAERWLGDDHNLVVLCAELSKDDTLCGDRIVADRLRLAADRYQCELRTKATKSLQKFYGRKSRGYVRGIARAWQRWRHGGRTRSGQSTRPRAAA
jgi:CHAD domain-containing protein